MLLSGELIDAETALRQGLITRVVEDDALAETTMRFARQVARRKARPSLRLPCDTCSGTAQSPQPLNHAQSVCCSSAPPLTTACAQAHANTCAPVARARTLPSRGHVRLRAHTTQRNATQRVRTRAHARVQTACARVQTHARAHTHIGGEQVCSCHRVRKASCQSARYASAFRGLCGGNRRDG
jgi:enoyl-CoA hydratase/carnithine racemase